MKNIIFLLLIGACTLAKENRSQAKFMDVFLMNSFRADSINVKTQVSNNKSFTVTTNPSLGQAKSFVLTIGKGDSTIVIKDVIRGNIDSVTSKTYHPYLYIYYLNSKFVFNYSDTLLILE